MSADADDNDQKLEKALDLMRRMPIHNLSKHLGDLIDLCPKLTEDLLSAIDQPLSIRRDDMKQKDFIVCDYNRDGESFRSPWSNIYYPYISDGYLPPIQLREIEEELNKAFRVYTDMYYGEEALSSVYLWDVESGFASAILIKKTGENGDSWDSINVMEVSEKLGRPSRYKLTTTVLTCIKQSEEEGSETRISGSLTRQKEEDMPSEGGHTINIGQMVEAMENNIRQQMEGVYFGKTRDVMNEVRSVTSNAAARQKQRSAVMMGGGFGAELSGALAKRKPLQ